MYLTPGLHGDIESVVVYKFDDFVSVTISNRGDRDVIMYFHGKDGIDKVRRFHKQLGEAIDAITSEREPLGEQGDGTFRVERSA